VPAMHNALHKHQQRRKIIIIKALMNNSILVAGLTVEMIRTVQLPIITTNQKAIGIFYFLQKNRKSQTS